MHISHDFIFSTSKFHLQNAFSFQVLTTWILGSYKHTHVKALYNVLLRNFVNAILNNKILVPV